MNDPLTIRPATAADLPAIVRIYDSARRFMAANGNPNQWGDSYPDETIVRGDLNAEHLYVCLAGKDIVGVFCYFTGIEPDYLTIQDGSWINDLPYGVVHRLAVAEKQKGVASCCLRYAFAQCGNLRIDTHADNIPMQRTLAKNGFLRQGIVQCSHGGERIAYQKTTE